MSWIKISIDALTRRIFIGTDIGHLPLTTFQGISLDEDNDRMLKLTPRPTRKNDEIGMDLILIDDLAPQ